MEALADKRVLHVACGVWHTAAVAAEPLGGITTGLHMSELSPIEGEAIRQKLAAAYHEVDQVSWLQGCLAEAVQSEMLLIAVMVTYISSIYIIANSS